MKKALAFAAIIAGSLSLAACNFSTTDAEAEETTTEQVTEVQTPEQPAGDTATETQTPE